jgi:SH3-like domain-containing protein
MKMKQLIRILLLIVLSNSVYAESFPAYFVSLKSKEANLRTGPNVRYPIKFKIVRKNEPLKVINKFEHWRHVEDSDGDRGWIHVSNISSKKYAKTKCTGQVSIFVDSSDNSLVIAKAENNVLLAVLECRDQMCRVESNGIKGWIFKRDLWGNLD